MKKPKTPKTPRMKVLFLEISADLHQRFTNIARANGRTLTGEAMRRLLLTLEFEDWEDRLRGDKALIKGTVHAAPNTFGKAAVLQCVKEMAEEALGTLRAQEASDAVNMSDEKKMPKKGGEKERAAPIEKRKAAPTAPQTNVEERLNALELELRAKEKEKERRRAAKEKKEVPAPAAEEMAE